MLPNDRMRLGVPSVRRLAMIAIVMIPLVYLGLNGWFWLESRVPKRFYWQGALVFLVSSEVLYLSTVTAASVGTLLFGLFFLRARRRRQGELRIARGLLLCVSILVGALLAEGTAAVWQYRAHRFIAMPTGGLRQDQSIHDDLGFRVPVADYPLPTEFADSPGDNTIELVVLGESRGGGCRSTAAIHRQTSSSGRLSYWHFPGGRSGIRIWPGRDKLWNGSIATSPICRGAPISSSFTAGIMNWRRDWLTHASSAIILTSGYRLPGTYSSSEQSLSPLCGLIKQTEAKCRIALPPSSNRRRLVDVPVYTTTEYTTLLVDFRRRLERIVTYAEQVGALADPGSAGGE